MINLAAIPFIQAKHYTPGRRAPIRRICIHDMEAARSRTTALHVAEWFGGPNAPAASAHLCIDSLEIVQCLRFEDTAWAAPGENDDAIHLELAGFAKDSNAIWLADVGELELVAGAVAALCDRYSIPPVLLTPAELESEAPGIETHAISTLGHHIPGGHTDPGPGFPMAQFLVMVQAQLPARGSLPDEL